MAGWQMENTDGMGYIALPKWQGRGVVAGFTTRMGGTSAAPYNSLNMALHVGDQKESVLVNRSRFLSIFGGGLKDMVCCEQVHGSSVAVVGKTDAGRGVSDYSTAVSGCDALITQSLNLYLATFYADCFSLFFFDPRCRVVGVAHAGWKGTMAEIGVRTAEEMQRQFNCRLQDIEVFIGPGIGPCCFEIQPGLAREVEDKYPGSGFISRDHGNRYVWDLAQTNVHQLLGIGLQAGNIEVCGLCTACNQELFYSYRRDQGQTGRMGAFISIKQ